MACKTKILCFALVLGNICCVLYCNINQRIFVSCTYAWIGLRVRLGHPAGPHHQQQVHFKTEARNSPSRQRRRIRRAAAREKAAEEVVRNDSQVDIAARSRWK